MNRHLIAVRGQPAKQPPGAVLNALNLRVEHRVGKHPHHLLGAEPAAVLTRAARILAQPIALDDERILGLDLLGRAVMRVAIVDGDGCAHAILVVLGAPAAANQAAQIQEQLAVRGMPAVDVGHHQIGMVGGRHPRGNRRCKRFEDGVDDRHRIGHPHPHGRGARGIDELAFGQDHRERHKAAIVDRHLKRRDDALERYLCSRQTRRPTRVEKAPHLLAHVGKIDGHLIALHGDRDPHRNRLTEIDAVIIHE